MSDQPKIISDWTPADPSSNRLELALTDQMIRSQHAGGDGGERVVALRDTHDTSKVLYVTPGQVRAFGMAATERSSPISNLLASAATH